LKALVLLDSNVKGIAQSVGFAREILGAGFNGVDEKKGKRLAKR
jgi:hypothetical protein